MKFSEKNGFVPERDIQRNSLDDKTRIRLYNILSDELTTNETKYRKLTSRERLVHEMRTSEDIPDKIGYAVPFTSVPVTEYEKLYTETLDYLGRISKPVKIIEFFAYVKSEIMDGEWYKTLDLLEFIIPQVDSRTFIEEINKILEEENSIYDFSTEFMEFTNMENEADKQNIDEALKITKGRFEGSRTVMKKALHIFSGRNNPDFHNAIKESIGAVESLIKAINKNDKDKMGKQINEVCKKCKIPNVIKEILHRLWGYSSNENGVRHAKSEVPENISREETLFIISSCSAIISYLVSMSEKN